MRVRFLGVLLPLWCACSGTNVVAGPELTQAERIEASMPEWCDQMCSRSRSCVGVDCGCEGEACSCGVDDNCENQCRAVLTRVIHASAACAAAAGRLQDCYDAQGCGVFGDDQPCRVIEEEAMDCDDSYSPPTDGEGAAPTVDNPYYDGSASGSAGSANLGPSIAPSGPAVTCLGGEGGGQGVPEPGTTAVICEEARVECSDGHDYAVVCISTPADQRACTCFIDTAVTGAFALGESCPTTAEMNVGCGWRLTEF